MDIEKFIKIKELKPERKDIVISVEENEVKNKLGEEALNLIKNFWISKKSDYIEKLIEKSSELEYIKRETYVKEMDLYSTDLINEIKKDIESDPKIKFAFENENELLDKISNHYSFEILNDVKFH